MLTQKLLRLRLYYRYKGGVDDEGVCKAVYTGSGGACENEKGEKQ